jgi:UDPglucose--hexose-1-phosphate uridylyltransferase
MLCEYAHLEIGFAEDQGRVVVKNEHWVAVVPWWATWPYEILCERVPCSAKASADDKRSAAI